jgi:hypothetical protein
MRLIDLNQNEIKGASIKVTAQSIEVLSRIIRKAFDLIDIEFDYIYEKGPELIRTAKEYGLNDLSLEMEKDYQTALYNLHN